MALGGLKMKKRCPCCGDNLDRFIQPVILSVLAHETNTGYGIVKAMENYVTFKDLKPDMAGVYRYLKKMDTKGLIQKVSEEGPSYYGVTEEGYVCLENWAETLREYSVLIGLLAKEIQSV